jgi:HPt (histidine-containing phosphotransfer) domain-containing protein
LRRFRAHFDRGVQDIRAAVAVPDLVVAEERCHALKGVAGNIGDVTLHAQLERIDSDLKSGVIPDPALFDSAEAMLRAVITEVDGLPPAVDLAPAGGTGRLAPEQVRDLVGQLVQALQFDLGAAEPLLDQLRAGCAGTALEADISRIAGMVDVFDTDSALEHLRSLDPGAVEVTT